MTLKIRSNHLTMVIRRIVVMTIILRFFLHQCVEGGVVELRSFRLLMQS